MKTALCVKKKKRRLLINKIDYVWLEEIPSFILHVVLTKSSSP
jgi:hypothetical protein